MNPAERLKEAKEFLEQGLITQEDFNKIKMEVLVELQGGTPSKSSSKSEKSTQNRDKTNQKKAQEERARKQKLEKERQAKETAERKQKEAAEEEESIIAEMNRIRGIAQKEEVITKQYKCNVGLFGSEVKTIEYPLLSIPKGWFIAGLPRNAPKKWLRPYDKGRAYKPSSIIQVFRESATKKTIPRDFYIGKYPVTQELWKVIMENNPGEEEHGTVMDAPITNVSRYDCFRFCNALSKIEGKEPVYKEIKQTYWNTWEWNQEADGYRLPTAAEWEYAARAYSMGVKGTKNGLGYRYSGSDDLDSVAWYKKTVEEAREKKKSFWGNLPKNRIQPVGGKRPNGFGLYDMSGNVWEWVWDVSTEAPTSKTAGQVYQKYGFLFGGSYRMGGKYLEDNKWRKNTMWLVDQYCNNMSYDWEDHGFRIVRNA